MKGERDPRCDHGLSLSRRAGQSLVIGPDIVVTVVGYDRGQVKLRVNAPSDVAVVREELLRG